MESAYRAAAIDALRRRPESRPHPNRPGASQVWIHRTEKAEPVNPPPPPEGHSV